MNYTGMSNDMICANKMPKPIKLSKKEKAIQTAIRNSSKVKKDGAIVYKVELIDEPSGNKNK